jgi:hypothetical protein
MAILQIPHSSVVNKLDGCHQNSKTLGGEQLDEYQNTNTAGLSVVNDLRSINVFDNIASLLLLFVVP